jgi:hypothetical protein
LPLARQGFRYPPIRVIRGFEIFSFSPRKEEKSVVYFSIVLYYQGVNYGKVYQKYLISVEFGGVADWCGFSGGSAEQGGYWYFAVYGRAGRGRGNYRGIVFV